MKSILIFVSICCFTCNNISPQIATPLKNSEPIVIDVDNFRGERIYYSNIFNNVKIIPLETNQKSLIGDIYRINIIDNNIFILDRFNAKSLFIFTKEGEFIRKIGSLGKGPGEYLSPDDFCYDIQNNEILLLDGKTQKINVYDLYGNFKRNIHIKVGTRCTQIAIQNNYIYTNGNPILVKNKDDFYFLNNINTDGTVQKKWLKFPEYGWDSPVTYNSDEFFQTEKDIKFNRHFINTIYSIKQNEVYPFITLKSNNVISVKELNELKNAASKRYPPILTTVELLQTGKMWGIHNYLENDRIIFFHYHNYKTRYQLIYDLKTRKIKCGFLIDDITFASTDFYDIDANSLIGIVRTRFDKTLEDIVVEIKNKNLKIPQNELKKLDKINNSSNPVLIFYELKP